MADIGIVGENSAQYLNNKITNNSANECKRCRKMKRELEETLAEFSLVKLIIKLLQKELSTYGQGMQKLGMQFKMTVKSGETTEKNG